MTNDIVVVYPDGKDRSACVFPLASAGMGIEAAIILNRRAQREQRCGSVGTVIAKWLMNRQDCEIVALQSNFPFSVAAASCRRTAAGSRSHALLVTYIRNLL